MITLGDIVRDMISGLKGVAIARSVWMYGCGRIAIEPPVDKDGKPSEIEWADEQRVERIGVGPLLPTPCPPTTIKLGDRVRDMVSGYEGLASAECHWMSGNHTFVIDRESLHEGKMVAGLSFDASRLVVVKPLPPPMSKQGDPAMPGGPQNDPVLPRSM